MRQALVFSDSHGKNDGMLEVIRRYPEVQAIFHLGDSERGLERIEEAVSCPLYAVRGNCDFMSDLPPELVVDFAGHRLAMCHGHRYLNYGSIDAMKYWALEQEADIVMFGHTHIPYLEQGYELTVLNPGSISRPRQDNRIPTFTLMELGKDGQFHFNMCEYHPM
ncbi:MAG: metallophosphoesterase [Lachnospiraceae bacterium]|nr:metallophosphoesterase [Lachnospiraceae bacterium]